MSFIDMRQLSCQILFLYRSQLTLALQSSWGPVFYCISEDHWGSRPKTPPHITQPTDTCLLPGTKQNKFISFFKDLKMERASFYLFPHVFHISNILIFFTFVLAKKAKHKQYPPCACMGQACCQGIYVPKFRSLQQPSEEGR